MCLFRCNIFIGFRIIKEMPGLVGSGTLYITKSTEQSFSWEANGSSDSQEFPGVLLNPTVHYRIDKSPPPVPILSQISTVHATPFYVFKIHFNIFLTSTPRYTVGLFPSVCPTKILYTPLPFFNTCHMPCAFNTYILYIFIYTPRISLRIYPVINTTNQ